MRLPRKVHYPQLTMHVPWLWLCTWSKLLQLCSFPAWLLPSCMLSIFFCQIFICSTKLGGKNVDVDASWQHLAPSSGMQSGLELMIIGEMDLKYRQVEKSSPFHIQYIRISIVVVAAMIVLTRFFSSSIDKGRKKVDNLLTAQQPGLWTHPVKWANKDFVSLFLPWRGSLFCLFQLTLNPAYFSQKVMPTNFYLRRPKQASKQQQPIWTEFFFFL